MIRLLIADDDHSIRKVIKLSLSQEGYEIIEAANLRDTARTIESGTVDLLLIDVHFEGEGTCVPVLNRFHEEGILPPTVVLSGAASAKEAADAIRAGAYDFIEKPPTADRLKVSLLRASQNANLKAKLERLSSVALPKDCQLILGQSTKIQDVLRNIQNFAQKDIRVLITGESGTGKELVAQSLFQFSKRKNKPYITVNCAAIPENLIESELFGHKRGAFTGAIANQLGKIEMADGGTIFLDEVGELSIAAQSKLLRFLESGEIQPIGSTMQKKCDVRVIAATSRNLDEEMAKGHFRTDLFYRLNIGAITMPPLRERTDDIPMLFQFFVTQACKKYEEGHKEISSEAFERLLKHSWPGNVRELKNIAERSCLLAHGRIEAADIMAALPKLTSPSERDSQGFSWTPDEIVPFKEFKRLSEGRYLAKALAAAGGSVTTAATMLQLDRTHLHQKLNQLGLTKK